MSHELYAPVGYIYRADHYCLDCIPDVVTRERRVIYTQADGCNCAECMLDRIADDRGIDRYDERSFDSDDFPKSIPYHNDLHAECGPESYGYGPKDPEWQLEYCDARCGRCHAVIDGTVTFSGEEICPVFAHRKDK